MSSSQNKGKQKRILTHKSTLGNESAYVPVDSIVGRCKHPKHLGVLTEELMCQRKCLEKNCHWFYRFDEAPYWKGKLTAADFKTGKERQKDFARGEREWKRKAKQRTDSKLAYILTDARNTAAMLHMSLHITRVMECDYREKHFHYIINYVSDRPYNDANMYTALAVEMNTKYGKRFQLRHVIDQYGNYVTKPLWNDTHQTTQKGGSSHRNRRT